MVEQRADEKRSWQRNLPPLIDNAVAGLWWRFFLVGFGVLIMYWKKRFFESHLGPRTSPIKSNISNIIYLGP